MEGFEHAVEKDVKNQSMIHSLEDFVETTRVGSMNGKNTQQQSGLLSQSATTL